ncbi:MAG: tRNA (guanosine(18)-2'-O)-methyltransferase TrmH [Myxococcales bacterium]|nr:tRNA (guanosine(18)-2'-O)-methyltransferase TrmH [Myxococcales bacterium]|tara:strand:- start:83 stop:742 length:660 start_codon:yes stop_codon:yes gene_type:complete
MSPERFEKLRNTLSRRQLDLTILTDQVHKPHNISAIIRSCDAVGVHRIHTVWNEAGFPTFHLTSGGSRKWVQVKPHPTIGEAVSELKGAGMRVLAAHPCPEAVDFRSIDFTQPSAILMGAELDGVGPEALALADDYIVIPMMGLVRSLNVSVAAAIILFEAARQRREAGFYERRQMGEEEYTRTLFEWAYPELAEYCQRHELPYPRLDEDGELLDEIPH